MVFTQEFLQENVHNDLTNNIIILFELVYSTSAVKKQKAAKVIQLFFESQVFFPIQTMSSKVQYLTNTFS